ncbi:hypothetical protein HYFRA_00009897 [Hymenoscyphus fraxineus]|uniref:BTB domain-containing protein n=1 Tax=Hymenoscyphus fraxineus TaxID=746836 RepID=A0A9N9PWR5_9HELO|nr:hypothetical protein HYFRA_00009897 [Hymenoscyphus fraxineus]
MNSPEPVHTAKVTLQVGERQFNTTRENLVRESPFFAALLSENGGHTQQDGSYFVDADGDLFEHILRYLRRGVYPIFYDKLKGHDYALYLALLQEAKYFGIELLQNWLENKNYLQAVKITYTYEGAHDKTENGPPVASLTTPANTEVEWLNIHFRAEKGWICPHEISSHRLDVGKCVMYSRNRGEIQGRYAHYTTREGFIKKCTTTFDNSVCTLSPAILSDTESLLPPPYIREE